MVLAVRNQLQPSCVECRLSIRETRAREAAHRGLPPTLPPDLASGQVKAQIHNEAGENLKLAGQAVLTDPGGRAAAMSCPVCPPDPLSLSLSPSSLTGDIGTSQQIFPRIHWVDGTSKINQNPNAIDWFPGNPSTAWVSEATANFRVQFGPQPGSTSIGATMPNEYHYEIDHHSYSCVQQFTIPVSASPAAVSSVCPIPTGETTTASGWAEEHNHDAIHKFMQRLTPFTTSFAGRVVTESDAAPATDNCWFPGSEIPLTTGVTGGSWPVNSQNKWGFDFVGWKNNAITFYQTQRVMMGLPMPCEFRMFQRLAISCGTTTTVYRDLVVLRGVISPTGASSERDGVLVGRPLVP